MGYLLLNGLCPYLTHTFDKSRTLLVILQEISPGSEGMVLCKIGKINFGHYKMWQPLEAGTKMKLFAVPLIVLILIPHR